MVETFGQALRRLRDEHGLSLRKLAERVPTHHSYIAELEHGTKQPGTQMAARLDNVLDAGGILAALLPGPPPEHADRLAYVTAHPRRVDPATIDSLATVLAGQRRLEDSIGSTPLVAPVLAQLDLVTDLVAEAPGRLRPAVVDLGAQWAQFAGWLTETTGALAAGRRWYLRALEWATEVGNPHMVATVLSMRGHLAWVQGDIPAMIGLSQTAGWAPAAAGVRAMAVQQEARGHAILGDGEACDRRLDEAEALADQPGTMPPWMYFYDPDFLTLQRALAFRYLGRHEQAIELFTGALDRVPAGIRRSDWVGWYVYQLGETYAAAGVTDCAAAAVDEAAEIARVTGAARLAGEVEGLARQLHL